MKKLFAAVTILFATFSLQAAPASKESIELLFVASETQSMIDAMYAPIEQVLGQELRQAIQGKPINAAQQRVLDALPDQFIAIMREGMSWDRMKPLWIQIHQETFDQDEVDGLNAFYASRAGKAYLKKTPLLLQKTINLTQTLMQALMPKMRATLDDALLKVQATR